jgi:hypothetical protein
MGLPKAPRGSLVGLLVALGFPKVIWSPSVCQKKSQENPFAPSKAAKASQVLQGFPQAATKESPRAPKDSQNINFRIPKRSTPRLQRAPG